jgi:transcriptional regulator with XRE-family HTH domain|tara:strand:+ start:58 stop:324 length:267 start_codon:yes stop_codon:yes gene_type:complete
MPYNREAIVELRNAMGISQAGLGDLILKYAEINDLGQLISTKSGINRIERGNRGINENVLDVLNMIAQDNGMANLKFYSPPENYKHPK